MKWPHRVFLMISVLRFNVISKEKTAENFFLMLNEGLRTIEEIMPTTQLPSHGKLALPLT